MFKLQKIEGGRINVYEPEFFPVGSADITEGQALVLTNGLLVKAGSTTKPTFIALADAKANAADCAVGRVESNQLYEVAVTAAPTSLKPGTKVTIDSTALKVTATATDGVAEIVDLHGATKAGDVIVVRF